MSSEEVRIPSVDVQNEEAIETPLISKSTTKSEVPVISKSSIPARELKSHEQITLNASRKNISDSVTKKPTTHLDSKQNLNISRQRITEGPVVSDSELSNPPQLTDSTSFQGEEEIEEDLEIYPYGKHYEEITERHLKEIALKLGLIKLYWPEQLIPDASKRKDYPQSYFENSNKEKLLLWYTENFRRQYHYAYKDRKPLFLAAENECGLQKMVCTTIRPTTMRFPEFKTWEGCTSFVADYLNYEPLENPQLLPGHLYSPTAVLESQKGNIFEYATLLCSFLIGSGYDAYVASGYATREFCQFNQTRTVCPVLPDFSKKEEEAKDEQIPKYMIKAPADLRSKFLLEMDQKEIQKKEDKIRQQEEEERLAIEEFEKPAPDEIFGTRIHSWVVVLTTSMDVKEPFFIDPLTGNKYDLDCPSYLGLESLWNHTNYWVNLQDCKEGCKNLKFDLTDLASWEHLLAGEPWFSRKSNVADEEEMSADTILMEKHLDMPGSWVTKLDISNTDYENRFPKGQKTILYKKAKLERFAPYVQEDGLVTRITTYADYDWVNPEWVYEYYSNRADCLIEIRRNLTDYSILDIFKRGREDCLKEHLYYEYSIGVEDERRMEFFHVARLDGLQKLEMHPLYLIQHFRDREDFLFYRKVDYQKRGLAAEEGPKRIVLKLVEEFNRNPEKEADKDIARKTFLVEENQIQLKFHYAPNRITAATRDFIKPKMTEMGDRLTFNPELTAGYQPDPVGKLPKNSYLFSLLEEQLTAEEESLLLVRKMEDDITVLLKVRASEMAKPQLNVSIYNMERNKLAIAGMKEVDKKMRAEVERQVDLELDFIAPYFARLGNPDSVTPSQALEIRENCINDFKEMLVERINKIEKEFEELAKKIEKGNKWYEEEQGNLTKTQEAAYMKENAELTFSLHVLEIRIARFRELAPVKYKALEACLQAEKRLQILNN